jgi:hypothetical protein
MGRNVSRKLKTTLFPLGQSRKRPKYLTLMMKLLSLMVWVSFQLTLVECGHPDCNNPSQKSKKYSQTRGRGPIMRHWCSEHKFCSKCRSFEEAGNCPKVKQSNYNPNNPSSNPFSNKKVCLHHSLRHFQPEFPSKLMGFLVGMGQYYLYYYSLLFMLTIL